MSALIELLGNQLAKLVERAVNGEPAAREQLERVAEILGPESASEVQRRLDEAAIERRFATDSER